MNYIFSFLQILEALERHKNCLMKLKFSRDTQFPAQPWRHCGRVGEDPGNEVVSSYLRSSGIFKKGDGTFLHSQLYTKVRRVFT